MGTLTIRDLDDTVKDRLRVRAATNGRSMEAEARAILAAAVQASAGSEPVSSASTSAGWPARVVKPATSRRLPRIRRATGGPTTQEILDELRADRPFMDGAT